MNSDRDTEVLEAHKRMADTLVQLGFASHVAVNDATRSGHIFWTQDGLVFRDQLLKAYDKIANGKGKAGMKEFVTLLTWIMSNR